MPNFIKSFQVVLVNMHVLFAMGVQPFLEKGHNRHCGLICGAVHVKIMINSIPNLLKYCAVFVVYAYNIQMWPRAMNWRPMLYAFYGNVTENW